MKRLLALVVCTAILVSMSGCFRTYTFKKERVDQEITGNRGVILGEAQPAPASRKPPTRTVIGVDVEIPHFTLGKEKKAAKKEMPKTTDKELWGNRGYMSSGESISGERAYPYTGESIEEVSVVEEPAPRMPAEVRREKVRYMEYTVKAGDTLSSIAARSDIYGDAGKWNSIFEANKDKLKSPSRVYPGQVLRIPIGGEEKKTRRGRVK